MRPSIKRQLELVDWDFVEDSTSFASGIHWYPGTFVPKLPGTLIEALSEPKSWVFDPYCGSGTTGIVALMHGRNVFLSDSNPVALLATYSVLSLTILGMFDQKMLNALFDELDSTLSNYQGQGKFSFSSDFELKRTNREIKKRIEKGSISPKYFYEEAPNIDGLSTWVEKSTLKQFLTLQSKLEEKFPEGPARVISTTMLSAILRQICSQNQSWGHIADNVRPKNLLKKDVHRAAHIWIEKTRNRLNKLVEKNKISTSNLPSFKVKNIDWTKSVRLSTDAIDIQTLITSPPYAGALDYTLSQRLSFYLMGYTDFELTNMVNEEIGARRKRTKSIHITTWAEQLVDATEKQISFLSDKSKIAFVMPHKDSGRELGEHALSNYLHENAWKKVFETDRSIRQSRTRHSWTSIKKETILVFER